MKPRRLETYFSRIVPPLARSSSDTGAFRRAPLAWLFLPRGRFRRNLQGSVIVTKPRNTQRDPKTYPVTEALRRVYHGNGLLICAPANLIRKVRLEHHQLLVVNTLSLEMIRSVQGRTDLRLLCPAMSGLADFVGLFVLDFRCLGPVRGDGRRPDKVTGAD